MNYLTPSDAAWLESVGSRILYELDPKMPVLYVVPVESILGKLPVVPVGDFGSVPNGMRAQFPNALADRTPGAGDGCPVWYVLMGSGLVPRDII